MTGCRVEWPVHSKPIALSRADGRQIGVPHVSVDLVEADSGLVPVAVNQAQLDLFGDLREQCEVGAAAVESGAQR